MRPMAAPTSRATTTTVGLLGFQPTGMGCVESLSVPFSGVTSLIVAGRDPMPDADHGRW